MEEKIIKVAQHSDVNGTAGSIFKSLKEYPEIVVQAIGGEAVNQAVKSIITARRYFAPINQDLIVKPSFKVLELDDGPKTSIRFTITIEEQK